MQAITTKYIGPTNFKGSRIKATCAGGMSLTVGYKSELSSEDNHMAAAVALAVKLKWSGQLIQGSIKNGYAHVFVGGEIFAVQS